MLVNKMKRLFVLLLLANIFIHPSFSSENSPKLFLMLDVDNTITDRIDPDLKIKK